MQLAATLCVLLCFWSAAAGQPETDSRRCTASPPHESGDTGPAQPALCTQAAEHGKVDIDVPTSETSLDFCAKAMAEAIVHDNLELRHAIWDFLASDPIFQPNHDLSLKDQRELTLQRFKHLAAQRFFSAWDYLRNPRKFMASMESLMYVDYSLVCKVGAHFNLCGGTICKLGSKKHHDTFLDRLDTLDLIGSFGMTELGHGSNVMGIETTATYDPARKEFIINTPNHEAGKAWICGTAQHGNLCAVFAQLNVNGKWEGPHVFMTRIRDDNLSVMPGVRIVDHGPKMGLNGVDNGMLWFDHVRVPRDAMLDAFASVDDDGVYHSANVSVSHSQRFGTMVSGLTLGRLMIGQHAIDAMKIGVTIAIRYACQRPQFGSKAIMEYLTHQNRLLPVLAKTYALHLATGGLKEVIDRKDPRDSKLVHVISCGLKAAATWSKVKALQDCRECCGGFGFSSANRIGVLATDTNVDVTFEGDNTVLMQQVARWLLKDKQRLAQAPQVPQGLDLARTGVCLDKLSLLLQFRESALVFRVGSMMAEAAAEAVGMGAAAEASTSATRAFDENLDVVIAIGWANVERYSLDTFRQFLTKADRQLVPSLKLLAMLYGLNSVSKDFAFFLASGALTAADCDAIRAAEHQIYKTLSADGGRLALKLCEGFGQPEALISTPISTDWRAVGRP